MTSIKAAGVKEYLAGLPPDRRSIVVALRRLIRSNMPRGYREAMGYGMITWEIPLTRYPDTYNGKPLMYVALAAQKNHYALYLSCAYMEESRGRRLKEAFARAGRKIDMGRSCIRFKSLQDLELEAIAAEIASTPPEEFIRSYEAGRG